MVTEKLILENQNLIYSIIHKYYSNYPNKNDLFQQGCLGLIKASKNYNSNYDNKFSSYAYKYILGEISNYIREDKSVKISHDIQKLYYKVEKVRIMLYQKYMREPTIIELANFLELPVDKVNEILNIPTNVESLDEPVSFKESELNLYDIIPDGNKNIDDILALRSELDNLSSTEKELLDIRYNNDMTQNEAAKILGMSQVQVSRYEKKVLIKLRDRLRM